MIKLHLDVDLSGYITVAVDQHGGRSAPTVTNKFGLVQALAHAIRSGMYAQEAWRHKQKPLVFSLPVELYMVLRYTFCSPDRPISLFEAVCQNCAIGPEQLVAEYPTAEHARSAIDTANHMLAHATQRNALLEDTLAKQRLANATQAGVIEQTADDMRTALDKLGLKDEPIEGEDRPSIESRCAVLVREVLRLRAAPFRTAWTIDEADALSAVGVHVVCAAEIQAGDILLDGSNRWSVTRVAHTGAGKVLVFAGGERPLKYFNARTRVAVRRTTPSNNEDSMNSKDHPPLHTHHDSGFTAAVSDDPSIDDRLCLQLEMLTSAPSTQADPQTPTLICLLQATPAVRLRFAQARGWTASLSDEEGARLLAGAPK